MPGTCCAYSTSFLSFPQSCSPKVQEVVDNENSDRYMKKLKKKHAIVRTLLLVCQLFFLLIRQETTVEKKHWLDFQEV